MANSGRVEINSSVYVQYMEKYTVIVSEFPGFLGILAHAQAVCTRLSFPPKKESLGSRLEERLLVSQKLGL